VHRHRIDPLSAGLGATAAAAGVMVAADRADWIVDNQVWWIATVTLLLGVALVPWSRRNPDAD
jgi:hypothetical protein